MRIGYLLSEKDIENGKPILGCNYIVSSPLLSTTFPQDYITDYKSLVSWDRRSSKVLDTVQLAERKQLRIWIPAVDIIFGGWELSKVIETSTIDVVFFGSLTPSDEVKKALSDIYLKKKNGNTFYAPLISYGKYFNQLWSNLKKTDLFLKKTIVAVILDKEFLSYLKENPDFCDELLLWNRPEELESDLLEIIERNREMTKKVTGTGKKIQILTKGIVAVGPLSVRKSPDASSRVYKVLPKGVQLSFRKIEEVSPGMIWGMVNEEEWVLISNGSRKYVILDN